MLKAAVVGGPSLVFTRKHVASETKIRPHQYGEGAQLARRILGYDANSLYPSTMMKEMPCGPGVVTTYNHPELFAGLLPQLLYNREWFGFAEVDIEVPRELWTEFEEFPPIFINRSVPDSAVPQHMHDYLKNSGRKRFPEQPKLLGVMSAKKVLLYAPLLQWYLTNGLKLTAVHRTIDYEPREIFTWFVKEVADNRRKGDADKDKALLAEVFKLLGNSAYGKFIEAVERQNRTLYTCNEARGGQASPLDLVQRPRGDRRRLQDRAAQEQAHHQPPLSGGHRCLPAREAAHAPVLLRVPGPLPRSPRLRADPDGHGQHVLRSLPTRSSKTPSNRATKSSSRRTRIFGSPGTSGATASLACSSSKSRAPGPSPCAASATTWKVRWPGRRRCPPRASTSARTSCAGSGTSKPSRGGETWRPTEVSACTMARCTRTSSTSSA